ncbi:universal stress protein [Vagococcus acidifermentans]|uniref:Universal stress protein n=1 Tax=Vagococcus acidifermentans TaxID=564710 RepID=A0A430B0G0_9ENTE|nr:universal stress protein [Vagococcus acidifermentans]RSU13833.1 hypothetical protein CBF27_02730 [Vagococcus acidifermentans]
MEQYHHILVAYDKSEQSRKALRQAFDIAEYNNSLVTILYVADSFGLNPTNPVVLGAIDDYYKSEEYTLTKSLEKIVSERDSKDKPEVKIITLKGNAKRKIVKFAKERKIDLIVMGATGKHGTEQNIVGTTTSYVVNHAHCQVLVVR